MLFNLSLIFPNEIEPLSIFSFLKASIIVSLDPNLAFFPVLDSITSAGKIDEDTEKELKSALESYSSTFNN